MKASSCQAKNGPGTAGRRRRGAPGRRRAVAAQRDGPVERHPPDLGARRAVHGPAERGDQRLAAEAQPEHRHAGVVRRAQEGDLGRDPRRGRPRDRAVGPERDDGVVRAGRRPRVPRGRAQHLELDAAPRRPVGHQAGGSVGLVLDDERARQPRYPLTLKAPRMNGWMRQKYVYVPSGRFVGVFHVSRPAAAVERSGPCRARPSRTSPRRWQRVGDAVVPRARRRARRDRVEDVRGRVQVAERQRLARCTTAGGRPRRAT